jgi:type IV pilus assembly protein PilE
MKNGFTLIELMLVLAIIGILSAIAVPSYTNYIWKAKQRDGREDVYRVMAQQERYFLKNMAYTYNLGLGGIGYDVAAGEPVISPEGYYEITAIECNDDTIEVTTACVQILATGRNDELTSFYLESDGDKSDNL